jgi:hypothetical protein
MQLPNTHGSLSQSNHYIYTACDSKYFDSFAKVLINSIHRNTDFAIHVHLFNPTDSQLEFCSKHSVSVTHETVLTESFATAAHRWDSAALNETEQSQLNRTQNAMRKGQDRNILERMQKTYYACARFIRLSELFDPGATVLAIDVDAVVRSNPPSPGAAHDFYIHKITGKKARILAGGIWLNATAGAQRFLKAYAAQLTERLHNDYIYWGLDQDVLDHVVPQHHHDQLPIEYIDWNMQPNSYIWTAKGTRKELLSFVNESARYKSV